MRRPWGIHLAINLLGVLILLEVVASGIAFLLISVDRAAGFFKGPTRPGWIDPFEVEAAIVFTIMTIWGAWTQVGLMRRWPWARRSMVAMGGAYVCLGAWLASEWLQSVLRSLVIANTTSLRLRDISLMLVHPFTWMPVLTVANGIWWMVYFQREATKRFFAQKPG